MLSFAFLFFLNTSRHKLSYSEQDARHEHVVGFLVQRQMFLAIISWLPMSSRPQYVQGITHTVTMTVLVCLKMRISWACSKRLILIKTECEIHIKWLLAVYCKSIQGKNKDLTMVLTTANIALSSAILNNRSESRENEIRVRSKANEKLSVYIQVMAACKLIMCSCLQLRL